MCSWHAGPLWLKVRGRIGFAIRKPPVVGPVQTREWGREPRRAGRGGRKRCVRTIPVAVRLSSVYFDPRQQPTSTVDGVLLVTVWDQVVASSRHTGVGRENVWPGRTAPTVRWSDGAVPM